MEISWVAVIGLALLCAGLFWKLSQTRAARDQAERTAAISSAAARAREAEAGRSEVVLRALANACVDPVYMIDGEGRLALVNTAGAQLFPDARAGASLIIATRSAELDAIAADALREDYEFATELTLNGRLFRAYASLVDSDRAAPAAQLAILILRDVSELQRLGRARRDFVANISHELRTPLQAIRLMLDGAVGRPESLAERDPRGDWIQRLDGQVGALIQLTQELYDLSQIESGQLPMILRPENLRALAAETLTALKPLAERAGLSLDNQIPSEVTVLIDAAQIKRTISNLVHNAIKFTGQGGVTLLVTTSRPPGPVPEGDFITLGVRDTGPGISREDQPRIFERFFKADRARGQGGSGLGLAIARHIVERHGGQIWVESGLGHGATFHLTLPYVMANG